MKIKTWNPDMTAEETKDLAYWERNVLALNYADGWYYDDVIECHRDTKAEIGRGPRYPGWRRVLTLEGGRITFHIPDDFDVGLLAQVEPNWDGHTTEEKWRRILGQRRVRAGAAMTLDEVPIALHQCRLMHSACACVLERLTKLEAEVQAARQWLRTYDGPQYGSLIKPQDGVSYSADGAREAYRAIAKANSRD